MADQLSDLGAYIPEGWTGKLPPCQIQVDADGKMWHDGAPMIHPKIVALIYDSVHLDEDGVYFLEVDGKRCQLEVADTFHVVNGVSLQGGTAMLTLNDGRSEPLDPATLAVGRDDVLYCRVKGGGFPARFSRAAYYQLAERIVEQAGGFALELGGRRHPIAMAEQAAG